MTAGNNQGHAEAPQLLLFVAGNAPRSVRARANLSAALKKRGLESGVQVREIDLLEHPEQTLEYGVFATPALMLGKAGSGVLYGDLVDAQRLQAFLAVLDAVPD